ALGLVELQDIAVVEEREGPTSISTEQGRRTATITVPPASDNLAVATASVDAALDAVDLPDGASAEVGGVASQQADSFTQLGIAMLAAILIVYVVMVATFKSLRQPLLLDRKSTRLNSSHVKISYAVFCLKKKKYGQMIISHS